jgi:hypothetical protein
MKTQFSFVAVAVLSFGPLALWPHIAHADGEIAQDTHGETVGARTAASATGVGVSGHTQVRVDGTERSRGTAVHGGAYADTVTLGVTTTQGSASGYIARAQSTLWAHRTQVPERERTSTAFTGQGEANATGLWQHADAEGTGRGSAMADNGRSGQFSAVASIIGHGAVRAGSTATHAGGNTRGGAVRAGVGPAGARGRITGPGDVAASVPVVQPGDLLLHSSDPAGGGEYVTADGSPVPIVGARVSADGEQSGSVHAHTGYDAHVRPRYSAGFRAGRAVP